VCDDNADNDCDGLTDRDDGDCLVTDGLVGYWKFDEGQGTEVYDSSGQGHNGIFVNTPLWRAGRIGRALKFDGVNDYVDFGKNIPQTSTLSAFAWIKHVPDASDRCILSRGGYRDGWRLCINKVSKNSNPLLEVTCGADTTPIHISRDDVQLTSSDTWQHVGWTWDGATARLYLNGQEIVSGTNDTCTDLGIKDTSLSLRAGIGRHSFNFNGTIDEIRLYDRALSADEVRNIYDSDSSIPPPPPSLPPVCTTFTYSEWDNCQPTNIQTRRVLTASPEGCEGGSPTTIRDCTFIPPESDDLIGYWKFDEGEGTVVYDSSGRGHNGELFNGPDWATGIIDGALNFDGIDDYVDFSTNFPLTSTISAFAWIKHVPDSSERCVLSRGGYRDGWRLCIDLESNPRPYIQVTCGFDTTPSIKMHLYDVQTTVVSDAWQHVGWTWDGLTARLFLNGQEIGSGTNADCTNLGIKDTSAPLRVGIGGYKFHFNGTIDEIRIYNRALSADEILSIYESDSGTTP
jgi:hypothetical protein